MKKKYLIYILIIILVIFLLYIFITKDKNNNKALNKNQEIIKKEESNMNNNSTINFKINNTDFTATLEDNETVKRLLEEFPLEIIMNDLNNNEKYFYLDQTLPTNTKHIDKINTGDIMLYGNNCLVIFYDTFNTSYSYTKIGHINNSSSLKEVVGNNDIKVVLSK